MRVASEARAFHAMLEAAMARVLAEAAWARKTYQDTLRQTTEARPSMASPFAGASPKAGSRNCAPFASQAGRPFDRQVSGPRTRDRQLRNAADGPDWSALAVLAIRMGKHAGLGDQLTLIETKAAALHEKAVERFR